MHTTHVTHMQTMQVPNMTPQCRVDKSRDTNIQEQEMDINKY